MTYLASIYACLLALFAALLLWALPVVAYAALGSLTTWHRERVARRAARLSRMPARAGGAPASPPALRVSVH